MSTEVSGVFKSGLLARWRGRLLKYLVMGLALVIALFSAYVWLTLHWSYSEGQRAGYVQKFSSRGWVCKTWEGELSLFFLPGATPEKFFFTVRDDEVAKRINAVVGQRVELTYSQHKGVVSSCFGDTEYFVTDIKVLGP